MLNKVMLIGHLGQDPEFRHTPGGMPVATFSLATNKRWTDQNGPQEKVEWHRIVVWDKLAENCAEYLTKGKQVYVEGSLQTRSYTGKDGVDRKATEIVARQVQFLGTRDDMGLGTHGEAGSETALSSTSLPADDEVPF